MTNVDDIDRLAVTMRRAPAIASQPGDYAAPLDEHDPDGDVVVYRADGTPVAQMPRATWDTLRGEAQ